MNVILSHLIGKRLCEALKQSIDQFRIARNHRKGQQFVRKHYFGRSDLRVHFGCGRSIKKEWLNTDLWPGPWATPDFCVDVSRTLPFESSSIIEIYTEHMFEHLEYPETASHFLDECLRIMVPGGKMTIGVPDVDPLIASYISSVNRLQPPSQHESNYCLFGHPLERLNFYFHQRGEHKFLYSYDHLRMFLSDRGFIDISRRAWDGAVDSIHRRDGTLYAICYKPGDGTNSDSGISDVRLARDAGGQHKCPASAVE